MTRQANILSFDEVKSRESSSPRTVSPSRSSRRLRQDQLAEEQQRRAASRARDHRSAQRLSARSSQRANVRASRETAEGQQRQARQRTNRSARTQNEGTLDKLRKRFRSVKADRQFDRTIGAKERSQANQAAQEQGSRAAVYNMSMGSTHRRSARMAEENVGRKASGFSLPFSIPFASNLSAAATTALVGAFALAVGVVLMYPAVANYYNETRTLQQLEAEYAALEDYNTQVQAEVNYLGTDEGLEEYARSELGWVGKDENVVDVKGVQSTASSSESSASHVVQEGSIKAPDTWYSGVLDVIFGYAG